MMNLFNEFAEKVLKNTNILEVNDFLKYDNTAVLIKNFDNEVVIIKYFATQDRRIISSLYINFQTKKYEVYDIVNQNNVHDFLRLEYIDHDVIVHFRDYTSRITPMYNFPKGDSFGIKVINGGSGTGSGWGIKGLGLD